MNEYELLYIVSPRVPADDVANAIERVNALVTAQGGEVLSVDNWGRRRLAYPIRQYFEGTYVLIPLKMPPTRAVSCLSCAPTSSQSLGSTNVTVNSRNDVKIK